jgi:hypothetical protein
MPSFQDQGAQEITSRIDEKQGGITKDQGAEEINQKIERKRDDGNLGASNDQGAQEVAGKVEKRKLARQRWRGARLSGKL